MAMAAVPAALSIASAGFTAASAITKGEGTDAADQFQAEQLQQQATYGQLKAVQTDAQMGQKLNIALGNVSVARAAGGVDPTSPTTAAIQNYNETMGDQNKDITVDNIKQQADQNESDASYMRYAGDQALTQGYLGAAAGAAGALGKGSSSFGVGGSGITVPGFNPIAGASGQ